MKIKDLFKELLSICVLVPLLHNFCSAGTLEYTGTFNGSLSNTNYYLFNFPIYKIFNNTDTFDFSCSLSNFVGDSSFGDNGRFTLIGIRNNGQLSDTQLSYYVSFSDLLNSGYSGAGFRGGANLKQILAVGYKPASTTTSISFDWSCVVSGSTIGFDNGGSSDCSDYESQIDSLSGSLSSCVSQVDSLSGSLNICQGSLSSYESQIDSLSGSLNICQNTLGSSSASLSSCQNSLNSCLSANCPSVGTSWSALWINNIQHLGASNIYMTIPEEISWDYSYSSSGDIMEIDVEGYNVDYDYINGVVDIQKYKPSGEDFTNIVSNLGLYLKILLFLVFAFILIKRIKKPFSSKLK